ncbi:unnamed protein product [Bursaphelenchus xylophilus]|uniref:(pine wood nematode) hypothetical protein n=1 Tax=Bursaphelenchus xylophilus TaxID=6326 RepID=A0A1I7SDM6_BURXY|nr:unnamed protein product [Bursaphelenchus xylophilus]CAG9120887.1 unnamed protein product [Bursaphelenchus xylophilus]
MSKLVVFPLIFFHFIPLFVLSATVQRNDFYMNLRCGPLYLYGTVEIDTDALTPNVIHFDEYDEGIIRFWFFKDGIYGLDVTVTTNCGAINKVDEKCMNVFKLHLTPLGQLPDNTQLFGKDINTGIQLQEMIERNEFTTECS